MPQTWGAVARILAKAALLFVLLNGLFATLNPLESIGRVSLYNTLLPGRDRLPYGEIPAESYNLSTDNIPAMFASHRVSRPKAADEYRVFLIGDSSAWGWFLENADTLAANINHQNLMVNGQRVTAYNLAYPIMSLTKDLLLLDEAMQYEPDMIIWLVTLASFPRQKQIFPPLVHHNPARVHALIERYGLSLNPDDPRFVEPDFLGQTIVGQRRALADWLRLQVYGFSWLATGVDQAIPADIPLRQSDFEADVSWEDFTESATLTADDLAFDVLAAGVAMADDVPVLIVNEPMFISSGRNSDLRYNSFYPRWVYDQYRALLAEAVHGDRYLDLWDSIAPEAFTDTPVHLTPDGSAQLAQQIGAAIKEQENATNG